MSFSSANLRRSKAHGKVLRHRSFVKRNAFMPQSFRCGLHKFTTSKQLVEVYAAQIDLRDPTSQ